MLCKRDVFRTVPLHVHFSVSKHKLTVEKRGGPHPGGKIVGKGLGKMILLLLVIDTVHQIPPPRFWARAWINSQSLSHQVPHVFWDKRLIKMAESLSPSTTGKILGQKPD